MALNKRIRAAALNKVVGEALKIRADLSALESLYEVARDTALDHIHDAGLDGLRRGDVLVFDDGRVEGRDAVAKRLSDADATVSDVIAAVSLKRLLAADVIKLDLAKLAKLRPDLVVELRAAGSPAFVPAAAEAAEVAA